MNPKICHLTSVHPRYDTRIFFRECTSLADKGYEVYLLVADGKGDETKNGVHIIDVGQPSGRKERVFNTTRKIYQKAREIDASIYHFHDPELIFTGFGLKRLGKNVIFDIHENIVEQISMKDYLPSAVRFLLNLGMKTLNYFAAKKFELILAEESYKSIYPNATYTVLNLPDTSFFEGYFVPSREKLEGNHLFYIGGVTNARGLDTTLQALKILDERKVDFTMHFIGNVNDPIDQTVYSSIRDKVVFYGRQSLDKGYELSRKAKIGLAVLKPEKNYLHSYPTKIFEYMSIGMPVITSDFEIYKEVVEQAHCGLCVDPLDAEKIADAIQYILQNPKEAAHMAENGRQATGEKYNWQHEEQKLFACYKKLMKY